MDIDKVKVYQKMEEMRKNDSEFDELVKEIDLKVNDAINSFDHSKIVFIGKNICYNVDVKVSYKKSITREQEIYLLKYLGIKYLKVVSGDFFTIQRCLFSKKYKMANINLNQKNILINFRIIKPYWKGKRNLDEIMYVMFTHTERVVRRYIVQDQLKKAANKDKN